MPMHLRLQGSRRLRRSSTSIRATPPMSSTPQALQAPQRASSLSMRALANNMLWHRCKSIRWWNGDFPSRSSFQLRFDASIRETWLPFMVGGALVLISDKCGARPKSIVGITEQRAVTVAQFVPSLLQSIIATSKQVKRKSVSSILFSGGEPLSSGLARDVVSTSGRADSSISTGQPKQPSKLHHGCLMLPMLP